MFWPGVIESKVKYSLFSGYNRQLLWKNPDDNRWRKWSDFCNIGFTILFFIPPLLAIIIDGLNKTLLQALEQLGLWKAFVNSAYIAVSSGLLCMALTIMLLWTGREFRLRRLIVFNQALELSGLLILAMPSTVLAVGFFFII